ncbi:hypothetical protein ACFCV8_03170 [Streptomyces sp. NPDC056347]|uniref:hypothetical protein n=1 Tax=Streptomyces sp. NPDC056347 TaxID=3345790 RepID=UPI0035D6211F
MIKNPEITETEPEKPPPYIYALPALMLSGGLAGIWVSSAWWAVLLSGAIILAGLNASINLAHAEVKAHRADLTRSTLRPVLLFIYAAAVTIAAVFSFIA